MAFMTFEERGSSARREIGAGAFDADPNAAPAFDARLATGREHVAGPAADRSRMRRVPVHYRPQAREIPVALGASPA